MQRTSGCAYASHSSTLGRRAFSELTFEVAIRMTSQPPFLVAFFAFLVGAAAFLAPVLLGASFFAAAAFLPGAAFLGAAAVFFAAAFFGTATFVDGASFFLGAG